MKSEKSQEILDSVYAFFTAVGIVVWMIVGFALFFNIERWYRWAGSYRFNVQCFIGFLLWLLSSLFIVCLLFVSWYFQEDVEEEA